MGPERQFIMKALSWLTNSRAKKGRGMPRYPSERFQNNKTSFLIIWKRESQLSKTYMVKTKKLRLYSKLSLRNHMDVGEQFLTSIPGHHPFEVPIAVTSRVQDLVEQQPQLICWARNRFRKRKSRQTSRYLLQKHKRLRTSYRLPTRTSIKPPCAKTG